MCAHAKSEESKHETSACRKYRGVAETVNSYGTWQGVFYNTVRRTHIRAVGKKNYTARKSFSRAFIICNKFVKRVETDDARTNRNEYKRIHCFQD